MPSGRLSPSPLLLQPAHMAGSVWVLRTRDFLFARFEQALMSRHQREPLQTGPVFALCAWTTSESTPHVARFQLPTDKCLKVCPVCVPVCVWLSGK